MTPDVAARLRRGRWAAVVARLGPVAVLMAAETVRAAMEPGPFRAYFLLLYGAGILLGTWNSSPSTSPRRRWRSRSRCAAAAASCWSNRST
jgi:hypothetical protein